MSPTLKIPNNASVPDAVPSPNNVIPVPTPLTMSVSFPKSYDAYPASLAKSVNLPEVVPAIAPMLFISFTN